MTDERIIEQTHLERVVVSTVDLSKRPEWAEYLDDFIEIGAMLVGADAEEIPQAHTRKGRYETMVFTREAWDGDEPLHELACRRYDTVEEAREGHAETVKAWERG